MPAQVSSKNELPSDDIDRPPSHLNSLYDLHLDYYAFISIKKDCWRHIGHTVRFVLRNTPVTKKQMRTSIRGFLLFEITYVIDCGIQPENGCNNDMLVIIQSQQPFDFEVGLFYRRPSNRTWKSLLK